MNTMPDVVGLSLEEQEYLRERQDTWTRWGKTIWYENNRRSHREIGSLRLGGCVRLRSLQLELSVALSSARQAAGVVGHQSGVRTNQDETGREA